MEVSVECLKKPLTNRFGRIEGTLTVLEKDKDARYEKIDLEEYDPRPLVILDDGTTIDLDSTELAFDDFATE